MAIVSSDDKTWATLAHLGGFFFWILAPLIIWLVMKEKSSFVDKHAKEALNFQISVTIYWIVVFLSFIILIGFLAAPALFIFELVVVIQAAMAANRGQDYKYPLCIRFIS